MDSPTVGASVSKLAGCECAESLLNSKQLLTDLGGLLVNWPYRNRDPQNLFRNLPEINWFAVTNFPTKPYAHLLFITTIWQILARGENYSRQWGTRGPREKFWHMNENWLAIFYLIQYNYRNIFEWYCSREN